MRISDWSSDVCSSDLGHSGDRVAGDEGTNITDSEDALTYLLEQSPVRSVLDQQRVGVIGHSLGAITTLGLQAVERSEERRVGKECGSTCRSRGSAYT